MYNKDIVIDNNDSKDNIKVVLNSQNSQAIRELMDKVSADLMEKNKELYERLANKQEYLVLLESWLSE